MKAVVQERYGSPDDVLSLQEVDKPVPKDDEVLVRVRAASMHADVWHVVVGLPYILRLMGNGARKPKRLIPGTDLAGVIESVGKDVTRLKVGDEVFGESAKFGWYNGGAYAEYAAVPEELLVLKPSNITFEEAAAVPTSGIIALSNVGSASKAGQNILINGAGGAMGSLAIQIAKAQGARVTAVDCAAKLPMLRLLGADRVIDYAQENYLQSGERYDLIVDVASILRRAEYQHALTPAGRYVPIGHAHYGKATRWNGRIVGSLPYFIGRLLLMLLGPRKRRHFTIRNKLEVMTELQALLECGKVKPIVAKTFPLGEVAVAMRCMQEGSTLGRIIITP
ncbi:MAG: NAD(P)-dependent alcohol dehydrogenase [Candidatus Obscuribacterales bacterium]|nr:NAD(P)-dependent alcohol dehydrogenase [Steroidobacteraceae bacterium]